MSKEEIIAFLNDMIDALTWKRFILLTLMGVVTVGLLMVFENRVSILNRLVNTAPIEELATPWEVSQTTKDELTALTKLELIAGVVLTEVNLKKNRTNTKFWYVNSPELRTKVQEVLKTLLPQALFNTDKKNNEQILAVLSNQFVCSLTEDTVIARLFPEMSKKYPTVCRLAVPPFTGEFAGMITIVLTRKPTSSEVDSLKIEITRVSVEMYLRDIQNRGRKR